MYASIFNTESFVATTLFIEHLLQNEDHIFNIIDQCQNNPTLSFNLQLILEAAITEKQLEGKLGYKDDNVLRLHTIVKLPVVPDYIPSHFAGQGIVQYFEKFDAEIHAYGKKFPTSPRITAYHPYQRTPTLRCSKCKKLGHIRKNCSDYQCRRCLWWGPGHTTPNCETKDCRWGKEVHNTPEYRPWAYNTKTGEQQWKAIHTWAGVVDISNKEWESPKKQPEVIDLTSPSPPPSLLPPTPPPSLWTPPSSPLYRPWSPSQLTPLLDLSDLVSDFDSVASSNSSISDLGNVGDIEV
ncbi:hypothetical protein K443DRAFT_12680 [Laccaria amethystina LaAM-08-1]|uniref:CCHC-type domain-containing protein n=1 Tax=Laccaria amethystina LaAM-08-1 TaxID=1095629 RepID=A0A0C9WIX2_9AGAR|nr:hypothetical protein K443DRAFT_12680 [Laccaria amethystina LaAM-08-1]